jgi:ubiquinone/menaquinone biosynthesis C-methylase UbiE
VGWLVERLPTPALQALVLNAVTQRAHTVPPAQGLRLLFELDAELYRVAGQLAIAYGDGLHTKHRHTRYHDFFVDRVKPGDRVLDIGCGVGAVAFDVAMRAGAQVVGIDLAEANVDEARRRHAHPSVRYIHGDALTDLPNEKFDVIILSNVLEHLKDRPAFLRRVQAAARPERWLIRVPVFERDWRVPLKQELGVEWRLDPTHETEYTLESFRDEMERAGLFVKHQEHRWGEIWAEAVPAVPLADPAS